MKKSSKPKPSRVPKVRLVEPHNRPIQLRYFCPEQQKEVRISTGTRDKSEALQEKRALEAKLVLGLQRPSGARKAFGPQTPWAEFREQYRTLHLATLKEGSAEDADGRLDIAERILAPRVLADMAGPEAMHPLQAELLSGAESKLKHQRSPHTVKSYMTTVMAAINWAGLQGWVAGAPKIRKIKVAKLKRMKGRPLTEAEFQKLLDTVEAVVGSQATDSWKFVLRGLWESALRLDELLHVSWDDPTLIRPVWKDGLHPVLHIPHDLQKNANDDEIPLLPGFERLLLKTPADCRTGWVFRPASLRSSKKGPPKSGRPLSDWVGRIISRIGKKAKIVVEPRNNRTGRPEKFASAHDLRRSCAERLREDGVPPLVISRILRHSSWETTRKHYAPGNVQKDAEVVHKVYSKTKEDQNELVQR